MQLFSPYGIWGHTVGLAMLVDTPPRLFKRVLLTADGPSQPGGQLVPRYDVTGQQLLLVACQNSKKYKNELIYVAKPYRRNGAP